MDALHPASAPAAVSNGACSLGCSTNAAHLGRQEQGVVSACGSFTVSPASIGLGRGVTASNSRA